MVPGKMHDGEVIVDVTLVRRLLGEQFPHWADLRIARVESDGTDHAIFRLGEDKSIRMPRIEWAVGQAEWEHKWITHIAPALPLEVPESLVMGQPGAGYPWRWSIHRWIDGDDAAADNIDQQHVATQLAGFIAAMRQIDVDAVAGFAEDLRPLPKLSSLDPSRREAIRQLRGIVDTAVATEAWERALAAPGWTASPVLVHGDLSSRNLLVRDGRIVAVIDIGPLGLGDPAMDLIAAWELFTAAGRQALRQDVDADDATWDRGRGWALSKALIGLPYYHETNPEFAAYCRRIIENVLADAT